MTKQRNKHNMDLFLKKFKVPGPGSAATLNGYRYEEFVTRLGFIELERLFDAPTAKIGKPLLKGFTDGIDLTGSPIIPLQVGKPNKGDGIEDVSLEIRVYNCPEMDDTCLVYNTIKPENPLEIYDIAGSAIASSGDPKQTYYLEVRWVENGGNWASTWTEEVSFDYEVTFSVDKPQILYESYRFVQADDYAPAGGWTGAHTKSDWEVSSTGDMTNIVFTSYDDQINLTSIVLDTLTQGYDYWVRVRYKSGSLISQWSDPFQFHAEAFIVRPVILYPTNTNEGTNSIVVSEHDNVNTPYPDPEMIVEYRFSDDNGNTWSNWYNILYSYNADGIYDVYLDRTATNTPGEVRIWETRCRYRKYTGPNPLDFVYSAWSNTVQVTVDASQLLTTGPYVQFANTGPTGYRARITGGAHFTATQTDKIEFEFYTDRSLQNLDNKYIGPSTGIGADCYTAPYWQYEYFGSVRHWFPADTKLYVRSRRALSTGGYGCWSDVRIMDLTGKFYPASPTMVDPVDGAVKNNGLLQMTALTGISTDERDPLYIKVIGLDVELGTQQNPDGSPNPNTENIFYPHTDMATANKYITGELVAGQQYYVRMKYHSFPELPTGSWSDTVSFTVDPTYTNTYTIRNDFTIGGETSIGIPTTPLYTHADLIITPPPDNPRYYGKMHIYIKDSAGNVVYHKTPDQDYYPYDHTQLQFHQHDNTKALTINEQYTIYYRYARPIFNATTNDKASPWQSRTFTPTVGSITVQEPTLTNGGAIIGFDTDDEVIFTVDAVRVGYATSAFKVVMFDASSPGEPQIRSSTSQGFSVDGSYNRIDWGATICYNQDKKRVEFHSSNQGPVPNNFVAYYHYDTDTWSYNNGNLDTFVGGRLNTAATGYNKVYQTTYIAGGRRHDTGYDGGNTLIKRPMNSTNYSYMDPLPLPKYVFGLLHTLSNGEMILHGGNHSWRYPQYNSIDKILKISPAAPTGSQVVIQQTLPEPYYNTPGGLWDDTKLFHPAVPWKTGGLKSKFVTIYDFTTDTWDYIYFMDYGYWRFGVGGLRVGNRFFYNYLGPRKITIG